MAEPTTYTPVRVGQVWEQQSGDLKGRQLKVLWVDHVAAHVARLEVVRNAKDTQDALDGNPKPEWKRWGYMPNDMRGRKTNMQVASLRSPRFRLVEGEPAESPA